MNTPEWGKSVGCESRRSFEHRLQTGFFDKYMSGKGIEVGFKGYEEGIHPILPGCIGVDLDYPGYDGRTLPFGDGEFDYCYSSHTLEHIADYQQAIREWFRVVRVGGYIVITAPHRDLYEKKLQLPSRFNGDHKRLYTPSSLLNEIEQSLVPNTYRVRSLQDEDEGFDYTIPPTQHSVGSYQLTVVLERIKAPDWKLE